MREGPPKIKKKIMGRYQSGQMGQTVNLLAYAYGGSNPSLPTQTADIAQLARARDL